MHEKYQNDPLLVYFEHIKDNNLNGIINLIKLVGFEKLCQCYPYSAICLQIAYVGVVNRALSVAREYLDLLLIEEKRISEILSDKKFLETFTNLISLCDDETKKHYILFNPNVYGDIKAHLTANSNHCHLDELLGYTILTFVKVISEQEQISFFHPQYQKYIDIIRNNPILEKSNKYLKLYEWRCQVMQTATNDIARFDELNIELENEILSYLTDLPGRIEHMVQYGILFLQKKRKDLEKYDYYKQKLNINFEANV